jgi:hypothetical protein
VYQLEGSSIVQVIAGVIINIAIIRGMQKINIDTTREMLKSVTDKKKKDLKYKMQIISNQKH